MSVTALAVSDSAYRLFREGCAYWLAGDAVRAYAVFQTVPQPLPPLEDLRLYALAASALDSGRTQVALAGFEKVITEFPDSPWKRAAEQRMIQIQTPPVPVSEPEDMEERATALFRAREYKKAVPVLKELLKRKGHDDVPIMTMLASAYARSNQYDDAIAMQRQLMRFPAEARKAMVKIVFLQFDRGDDKATLAAATEYNDRYPNGPDRQKVAWMRAWSHFRLKDWPSAITSFDHYSTMTGSREEKNRAGYWSARTLEMMGNKAGAATAFGVLSSAPGYYGQLASARLRHRPMAWQLPHPQKMGVGKLNPESASTLLTGLGFYEFVPVYGWNGDTHHLVERAAPHYGLTPGLVNAIIEVESHFRPNVVSPAGAIGLMQLIPPTAMQMSREMHLDMFELSKLRDPVWNVTLGMDYLRKLSRLFDRNLVAIIASYNAGEQAVSRWMEKRPLTDPEIFIESIPYDETQAYVKKVLALIW